MDDERAKKINRIHKTNHLFEKLEKKTRGDHELRMLLKELNDHLVDTIEPEDGVSVLRVNWNT